MGERASNRSEDGGNDMYVVFEYLTYLVLLVALGGFLFVTSAAVLLTEASAKYVVQSTRRLAVQAGNIASKHLKEISHITAQPSRPKS
jgi:hypothetical protein